MSECVSVGVDPGLQRLIIFLAIAGYAGLFGSLLIDTINADEAFDPRGVQSNVTPVLSGALGLVLALSLGVEATITAERFWDRVKQLFEVPALLRLGAWVYALSALLGGVVWGVKDEVTPDLVTTVVLTVAGYAAGAMTALARKPGQ